MTICPPGQRVTMNKTKGSILVDLEGIESYNIQVLKGGYIPYLLCELECVGETMFDCRSFMYTDKQGFGDLCILSNVTSADPSATLTSKPGTDLYQWKCEGG